MNSFVTTVLRRRRGEGASGEQGKDTTDEVYSNPPEGEGGGGGAKKSLKGKRRFDRDTGEIKRKQGKDAVSAEQALSALRRSREPFIANESVIAPADASTIVAGSDSSASCEITLEELPLTGSKGQMFGHQGWVAGGDVDDEEEEPGADALAPQTAKLPAGDAGQRMKNKMASKEAERVKPSGAGATPKKKSEGGGMVQRGKGEKPPDEHDEIKWSGDEGGEPSEESLDEVLKNQVSKPPTSSLKKRSAKKGQNGGAEGKNAAGNAGLTVGGSGRKGKARQDQDQDGQDDDQMDDVADADSKDINGRKEFKSKYFLIINII